MSATTVTAPQRGLHTRRIANVVRLLFVNPRTLVFTPWMVMAIIFAVSLIIWLLIASQTGGRVHHVENNGSLYYLFVYMTVAGVLSISSGFPFALGLSITRREYYLGTALAFGIVSLGDAILLTALAAIERATDGWGIGGYLFAPAYLGDNLAVIGVIYLIGLLFFSFVGAFAATVYMRWRMLGMLTAAVVFAAILLGAVAFITLTHSWPTVGAWFVANGAIGVALWMLVPTAVFGFAGFFVLRGATPKM